MSVSQPIHILHVVGKMDRGGVETWLMHLLKRMDRSRYQMDFLTLYSGSGAYDAEIQKLGSRVLPCPVHIPSWKVAREFQHLVSATGPYDIIHCHVGTWSGLVLRLAARAGISVRIVHSHNDTRHRDPNERWWHHVYNTLAGPLIDRYATHGFAVSEQAALAMFGYQWTTDPRWSIIYSAIDLGPFYGAVDRTAMRDLWHLPADAIVIGHVGRFDPQKNHRFLLEIAQRVLQREPRAYFVLVGDGRLRPAMERNAYTLGLRERVRFLGVQTGVAQLMRGLMDVFLLPSLFEGLGLVALEAQAAGLPLVLADTIPAEVECIHELVNRLSLSQSVDEWASACLRAVRPYSSVHADRCVAQMETTPFSISINMRALMEAYEKACERVDMEYSQRKPNERTLPD